MGRGERGTTTMAMRGTSKGVTKVNPRILGAFEEVPTYKSTSPSTLYRCRTLFFLFSCQIWGEEKGGQPRWLRETQAIELQKSTHASWALLKKKC
ncbi:hypothetical protein CJ030_MR2G013759 [Morella rubra]|uniref:Uncharacterized protein n=1 Tax=Morella rubra TaxID=262757 RepID=A0A6A1WK44_9ROSI|nr:hypothetical protein CJ030_MR2G013759 [Morella rubra]